MKIFGAADELIISLEGAEKIWALKSKLIVPRAAIAKIDYDPTRPAKRILALPFFKFPGSVIPGIMFAGTFIKPGERDFWYIRVRHAGVLSIQTVKGGIGYDRIMLSCDPDTAQDVAEWWKIK